MGNAPVKSDTNQRGSINYKSSFHGHEHAQDNHKKAAAKLNPLTEEEEVSLTDDDIRLVRMSWNTLMTKNDLRTYGTNMMIKIFVKHPEIKPLWKFAATLKTEQEMRESAQLKSHGKNVFEAINAAVYSLDKIDALNSSLNDLGSRHYMYGARALHFPIIGEALLETIAEALAPNFTPNHRISWEKIIKYFAREMSKQMG